MFLLQRIGFLNRILTEIDNVGRLFWNLARFGINLIPPTCKLVLRHLVRIESARSVVVCAHHLLLITRISDVPCLYVPPWSNHPAQVWR